MIFSEFTKLEINRLIENCNFTDSELQFFLFRCKGRTLAEIADEMKISESTADRLCKKVKSKISRVV